MRVCEKAKARTCNDVYLISEYGESLLNRNQVFCLKSLLKQVRKLIPDIIDETDTDVLMKSFEPL